MTPVLRCWWLLSSGWISYLCLDFLLRSVRENRKPFVPIWVLWNGLFTMGKLRFPTANLFLWDISCFVLFAGWILKIPWRNIPAPTAIVFTLYTWMEGFSAVLNAWTSKHWNVSGTAVQIAISFFGDLCFFLSLQFLQKKCLFPSGQTIPSHLSALLLPCALTVLAVRCGLRLDSHTFEDYLSAFGTGGSLTVLLVMFCGIVIFFLIVSLFCEMDSMAHQKSSVEVLTAQLAGQNGYIKQAKQKMEYDACLQHDIKNHLLVVSGLLSKGEYAAAEQYASRLQVKYTPSDMTVSTGRLALDILLTEKFSQVKRRNIRISYYVQVPSAFHVNDIDLCVVFANMLDNAMTACGELPPERRELSIITKERGRFWMIEARNRAISPRTVQAGIGLRNIENIAKKYQGVMKVENTGNTFRISVLLCSPEEPDTL